MTFFFELVIIAFLLLISIELLLIYRELVHSQVLRERVLPEKEDKGGTGQTINVNVASPAALGSQGLPIAGPVLSGAIQAGTAPQSNQAFDGTNETEQNRGRNDSTSVSERDIGSMGGSATSTYRTGPRSSPAVQMKPTNPFAKVCSSCGAENSVYRSECFNCGKTL